MSQLLRIFFLSAMVTSWGTVSVVHAVRGVYCLRLREKFVRQSPDMPCWPHFHSVSSKALEAALYLSHLDNHGIHYILT